MFACCGARKTGGEQMPLKDDSGVDMICMACSDGSCDFKPMRFSRRSCGPRDVKIDMQYCGICHTDVHFAAGHMDSVIPVAYPCVPGHELAGICVEVGAQVTKVKVGDHVGVGCMVDSCQSCGACKRGEEQMCMAQTATYCGKDAHGRAGLGPDRPHNQTLGGYSTVHVVDERFAVLIPKSFPLEYAGPVMCAGVTMFDPLKRQGATEGTRVGIVGLGGLGIMGIKLAKALGCEVTAISRGAGLAESDVPASPDFKSASGGRLSELSAPPSPKPRSKAEMAVAAGARTFVSSSDAEAMAAAADSLDLILNTIPCYHNYMVYQRLLTPKGKQVLLGLHEGLIAGMLVDTLTMRSSRLTGSAIGSIAATQECIDLCAREDIKPEVQVVSASEVNWVYEQLSASNDAGKRYVLDIAGTLNDDAFEKSAEVPPPDLGADAGGPTISGVLGETLKVLLLGRWW